MNQLTTNFKKIWRKSTGNSNQDSQKKIKSENKISSIEKKLNDRDIELLNKIENDYSKLNNSLFQDDFLQKDMTEKELKEYIIFTKEYTEMSEKDKIDTFYKYLDGKIDRKKAGKSLELLRFGTKIASSKESFLMKKTDN